MSPSKRDTERIRVRDDCEIHCQTLYGNVDRWLILVHGIGEHLGRAAQLAELFAGSPNVFQYDLRGHGQSEGRRGYVKSFDVHFNDLEDVVDYLASRHPNFRYALFGHSMGALIAAGFAQRGGTRVPCPESLFLASPPIGIGGIGGAIVNRLPDCFVSGFCRLPFSIPVGATINRAYLSHDKEVSASYKRDPLSLNRLHSKLLVGLVDASRTVFSRPITAPCPLFAAVGSEDRITSCEAARHYFATHEPKADFRVFDGAYHELHNETAAYREPYFAFLKEAVFRSQG